MLKAALRILLFDQKRLEVTISPDSIALHLPVQRDLSSRCSIYHSGMTEVLRGMELQGFIRKEERIGIWTRPKGNRVVADLIEGYYIPQAARLVGEGVLLQILDRFRAPSPEISDPDTDDTGGMSSPLPPETLYSPDRKVLKTHICITCGREFFSNDMRRKQCDACKPLSRTTKRTTNASMNRER